MIDTQKIDRFYYGRVFRWLLIGCLFFVGVGLFIWATFDETADWTATEDVIRGYRWQGLFFFALAIGIFVGVGWLVRFPLPLRRHRAFVKLFRAFSLVVLGFLLGYSFGFYGGVRFISTAEMETRRNLQQMNDAARIYGSEHSNHAAVVTGMSTNQLVPKP